MRTGSIIAAALLSSFSVLLPASGAAAAEPPTSSIHLTHSMLKAGQVQGISVTARDLAGQPLVEATVAGTVRYGSLVRKLSFPRTNAGGMTTTSFRAPSLKSGSRGQVAVTVNNGYISIPLAASFSLQGTSRKAAPAGAGLLQVAARVLSPSVTAPQPEWLLVYTRSKSGADRSGASVDASILFKSGAVHVLGHSDNQGVTTLRVDTGRVTADERVRVAVVARWKGETGTGKVQFAVQAAPAAAVLAPAPSPVSLTETPLPPTPTPVPPTSTPTPTATATAAPAPAVAVAPVPTFTPTETPLPTSTSTPLPTWTPVPTPTATNTLVPTPTFLPPTLAPTSTATATSTPTRTPTPLPAGTQSADTHCPPAFTDTNRSQLGCMNALLGLINNDRAQNGVPALTLDQTQSFGTGSCVGSVGHSKAMAQSGAIWHENPSYPQASWPSNVCSAGGQMGENVGMGAYGNEANDIQIVHGEMMSEPHYPGCQGSHSCNILSSNYTRVGIGIYVSNGATWITEDFSS